MSTTTHRFLVSPDGMLADWVHPQDEKQPRHEGWTDCTDMDDEELQRYITMRHAARPHVLTDPHGELAKHWAQKRAEAGKCDGSCEAHRGEICAAHVGNWGWFSYCEEAVAEDLRRGLVVSVGVGA